MIDAIYDRRSIRKYKETPVPKKIIEKIMEAAIWAPSAKNRQPWKFIVVSGNAKNNMLIAMKKGLQNEINGNGILNNSQKHFQATKYTIQIMEEAPVTVFILNTQGNSLYETLSIEDKVYERANIESISAAIQNMSLAATQLGLGSLWICDIYFAYDALNEWLDTDAEMVAAMTFGYPNERPNARPRKKFDDVVEWRL